MKNDPTLKTVEQLVRYTLMQSGKYPSYVEENRWTFHKLIEMVWDDPTAGSAWHDNLYQIDRNAPDYQKARDSHYDTMPPKHRETSYWLQEAGYGSGRINLSPELGTTIEGVWTMRTPSYSDTPQPHGVMTLPGILKRLGNTDIAAQIKDAKAKEQARTKCILRNNARREVRKAASTLLDAIQSANRQEVYWDDYMDISNIEEMTRLQDEDENA